MSEMDDLMDDINRELSRDKKRINEIINNNYQILRDNFPQLPKAELIDMAVNWGELDYMFLTDTCHARGKGIK